jgi:putative membrane protein
MTSVIKFLLNGLAFGITETVPGVSGGTVAVIFGFYNRLIETINHFTEDVKKHLRFVVPFLLGAAAGIVGFASVVNYLLARFSLPTMSLFIGLVMGIIPIIYDKVKEQGGALRPKDAIIIVIPIIALIVIAHLKAPSPTDPAAVVASINIAYMLFLLIAGMVAAAALIIPGISGSFVLLLIGVYPLAIYSLSNIRLLLTDITNVPLILDIAKVLGPLGVGIIIGGLTMARLIERLLTRHHRLVYSLILGLLIGSVYALFNEDIVWQSGISAPLIVAATLTLALGCAVSYLLGRKRL